MTKTIMLPPKMHKAMRSHIARAKGYRAPHSPGAKRQWGECKMRPERIILRLKEMRVLPNLFPDMSRPNYQGSDDFIFGAPIDETVWKKLCEMSNLTGNNDVPYYRLPKEVTNTEFGITVLLRNGDRTDNDMLEAAAWLRVIENNRDRIYAVPWYKTMDLHTALVKTIGAPRALSVMFDLPREENDE